MRTFLSLLKTEMLISGLLMHPGSARAQSTGTITPIKHVVVIFQENVSFDHYFGTYPNATNSAGEPAFHALPGTPSVNGLSGARAHSKMVTRIIGFEGYTGRYVWHCHVLEHEDNEMMRPYEVLARGT